MNQFFRPQILNRTLLASIALTGALVAGGVYAQGYSGPSSAPAATQGYTGPSSVAVTSVKALIETGRDDQNAIVARHRMVGQHQPVGKCEDQAAIIVMPLRLEDDTLVGLDRHGKTQPAKQHKNGQREYPRDLND